MFGKHVIPQIKWTNESHVLCHGVNVVTVNSVETRGLCLYTGSCDLCYQLRPMEVWGLTLTFRMWLNKNIFNAKISGVWKSSLEQFGVDGAKYGAMKTSLM